MKHLICLPRGLIESEEDGAIMREREKEREGWKDGRMGLGSLCVEFDSKQTELLAARLNVVGQGKESSKEEERRGMKFG